VRLVGPDVWKVVWGWQKVGWKHFKAININKRYSVAVITLNCILCYCNMLSPCGEQLLLWMVITFRISKTSFILTIAILGAIIASDSYPFEKATIDNIKYHYVLK
jgi:hypothetical protein